MSSLKPPVSLLLPCLLLLVLWARPAHAFGAGNIAATAKIEGSNWRHGDIEDTLLTLMMTRLNGGKKFGKLDVKRVYFGNWLRDYSQAVDVSVCVCIRDQISSSCQIFKGWDCQERQRRGDKDHPMGPGLLELWLRHQGV